MASFIKLEVVSGPDTGKVFEVREVAIIGRGEDCDIVLNDQAASSQHARINVLPSPTITDLGSANHVFHQGLQVLGADLNEGDSIQIGETRLRVNFDLDGGAAPNRDREKEKKRKGLLMMLAIGIVSALALVFFGLRLRDDRIRETTILKASKFSASVPFKDDRMTVNYALTERRDKGQMLPSDFNLPGVGLSLYTIPYFGDRSRYMNIKGSILEDFRENYRKENGIGPNEKFEFDAAAVERTEQFRTALNRALVNELRLATVYPPDPMQRGMTYQERVWARYAPRLGNGRFVPSESKFVLGEYRALRVEYRAHGYSNPTPKPLVQEGILKEDTTLYVFFSIESWDGLAPSMNIKFFALDLPAVGAEHASMPQVPRYPALVIARNKWNNEKSDDWNLYAATETNHRYIKAEKGKDDQTFEEPLNRFRVFTRKKGEMLYTVSAQYFPWQEERLTDFVDDLLSSQVLEGRKRTETPAELIKMAFALETEGDNLVPPTFNIKDLDTFQEKGKFWQAFNRYQEALQLLQVADKWRLDADYDRIFEKARKYYNYFEDENRYFKKTYARIEEDFRFINRMRRSERPAKLKELQVVVDELWKIALSGQEPDRYQPDEWFIYAQITRLRILKMLEEYGP